MKTRYKAAMVALLLFAAAIAMGLIQPRNVDRAVEWTWKNDLTLDDGSGAAPTITLTDGSDESAVFSKADSGDISLTIPATDSLNILTGNLEIGNGTPTQTLDGEDMYCEGLAEFDGVIHADGGIYIDDGSGATPDVIFTDGSDEACTVTKADSGNLSFEIAATDDIQILTGNLAIGNGTPGQTINGEDMYCEGLAEFDGVIYADGGVTGDITGDIAGAVTIPTAKEFTWTTSAVALTSPTVTFSVDSKSHIVLTADANLTGVRPTGGTLNQVIMIQSGDGSNTMRFDDGAYTICGSNVTLTEAQYDFISFVCVDASNQYWACISAHDN